MQTGIMLHQAFIQTTNFNSEMQEIQSYVFFFLQTTEVFFLKRKLYSLQLQALRTNKNECFCVTENRSLTPVKQ